MYMFCEPKMPLYVLWPKMEAVVENGLTKGIGLSNHNTQIIWDLMTYAKITPACLQIELNPQNAQPELVRFLHAKNIRPVGFMPVARPGAIAKGDSYTLAPKDWPDMRENEYLISLGKKYNKTEVQIMLNWGVCRGHVVIPKAASFKYQLENIDIFDFKLTEEEMTEMVKIDKGIRLVNKNPMVETFDIFA
jgi:D-xylose reductase